MKHKKESIKILLPEGTFKTNATKFEDSDKTKLKEMIKDWHCLSKQLKQFGGRGINIPEGISEPLYCLAINKENIVKISEPIRGANSSYDYYNKTTLV